jgi:hypothetical protein
LYLHNTPIAPDEKPEAVEVGVEADLSGRGLPLLVGIIDLVRAGGRIVDFKTSARKPNAELRRNPRHHEFQSRTLWTLFNSFTEVLKGNLNELPTRTEALHGLLDSYVGLPQFSQN